jgi:hypothetical protein
LAEGNTEKASVVRIADAANITTTNMNCLIEGLDIVAGVIITGFRYQARNLVA